MTPVASPITSLAMIVHIGILIAFRLYQIAKPNVVSLMRKERSMLRRMARRMQVVIGGKTGAIRPSGMKA